MTYLNFYDRFWNFRDLHKLYMFILCRMHNDYAVKSAQEKIGTIDRFLALPCYNSDKNDLYGRA